jgi:magnesium-protoporphyrin O-methyltransferase
MNAKTADYLDRRGRIEAYFDRTAAQAWARLTSDAPVSGIRATVRAGREQMRSLLVSWLNTDEALRGARLLDAGCGTGLLAVDAARLGALVKGIDLSPTLVALAQERLPEDLGAGSVTLLAGDMLDPALGSFEHLVAMDSLIHYTPQQAIDALIRLSPRVGRKMVFTYAPSNLALQAMITVGRLFPRSDRSPSIVPVAPARMRRMLTEALTPLGWRLGRTERVSRGFYTSQAQELLRQ